MTSLRARMTVAVSISFAVWMLVVCVGLIGYTEYTIERDGTKFLRTTVQEIQQEANAIAASTSSEQAPAAFEQLLEKHRGDLIEHKLALLVLDAQGQEIVRSQPDAPPWPNPPGDAWREQVVRAGSTTIVVGLWWDKLEDVRNQEAVIVLVLGLLAIFGAACAAWVLVGRTLSPIGSLSLYARNASLDNLPITLQAPSHDVEMVELVETLNSLLQRLSDTMAAKGRFYAAASHELRTPLQALSGHLEVALSRDRSPEEYRTTIEKARNQTKRLITLVRDLLILNQLDAAPAPPQSEPVNLPDICLRVLQSNQSLASQRDLTTRTRFETEEDIDAPPMHVEMLVRNLIENAIKYATPGGIVDVLVYYIDGMTTLTVFNTFPPSSPLKAEELFEPFFRQDVSRTSRTGGNGLGLAICNAITQVNGWALSLHQEMDGVRVMIIFTPSPHKAIDQREEMRA